MCLIAIFNGRVCPRDKMACRSQVPVISREGGREGRRVGLRKQAVAHMR